MTLLCFNDITIVFLIRRSEIIIAVFNDLLLQLA